MESIWTIILNFSSNLFCRSVLPSVRWPLSCDSEFIVRESRSIVRPGTTTTTVEQRTTPTTPNRPSNITYQLPTLKLSSHRLAGLATYAFFCLLFLGKHRWHCQKGQKLPFIVEDILFFHFSQQSARFSLFSLKVFQRKKDFVKGLFTWPLACGKVNKKMRYWAHLKCYHPGYPRCPRTHRPRPPPPPPHAARSRPRAPQCLPMVGQWQASTTRTGSRYGHYSNSLLFTGSHVLSCNQT